MKRNHIGEVFKEELEEARGGLPRKNKIVVSHAQAKRITYAKRIKLFADATGWLAIACTVIAVIIIAANESSSNYAGYNIGTLIGSCFGILLLTSATGLLANISISITEQAGRQKADSQ